MKLTRKSLTALAAAGLTLASASAVAQNTDKAAVKADIANWSDALTVAFSPGWWDGEMQTFDGNGKVIDSESRPACIKPGEGSKMGSDLSKSFGQLVDVADCTSVSGGPASLDLKLVCVARDGSQVAFDSNGTYSDGAVDWNIKFTSSVGEIPNVNAMKVSARRTRKNC